MLTVYLPQKQSKEMSVTAFIVFLMRDYLLDKHCFWFRPLTVLTEINISPRHPSSTVNIQVKGREDEMAVVHEFLLAYEEARSESQKFASILGLAALLDEKLDFGRPEILRRVFATVALLVFAGAERLPYSVLQPLTVRDLVEIGEFRRMFPETPIEEVVTQTVSGRRSVRRLKADKLIAKETAP